MKRTDLQREISRRLLRWFRPDLRNMPWRGGEPYAVWISEIMLQQTRVEAVKPYFLRFMRRFPTIASLAQAPLADVLKQWEGLGYYARARNLHKAAKAVCTDFGGKLPQTVKELRTLGGIGRYTAGAIASIAFGLDEPVLDGNVTRVLCRVFAIDSNPKSSATREELWKLAQSLLPPGKAGLFNQALMDLGATVCTPQNPLCRQCPLHPTCRAHHSGRQEELPVKAAPKTLPHYTIVAGVVWKAGRILIDRRKPQGLLGGLWEFPGGKVQPGETLDQALIREIREEVGISVRVLEPLVAIRHAYSHFRITLHVFHCRHVSGTPKPIACDAIKWVRPADLADFAFPKANHAALKLLLRGDTPET